MSFVRAISTAVALSLGLIANPSAWIGEGDAALVSEADARPARPYRYRRARPARVWLVPAGIYVGGGLVGTKILRQNGGPELLDDGLGLTLYGGLRLSRALALELGWIGTAHNPETVNVGFGAETDYLVLNGFTADAKIHFGGGADEARPGEAKSYLQGGLGIYFLDSGAFGTQSVGTGFQLGGGVDWAVGHRVDLGVRGLYRGIAMGPPESNQDDTFISAVTLEAALTFRF